MRINPEFLRNVWLELTPVRLLGMPAILAAIFLLIYLTQYDFFTAAMQSVSLTLFVVLIYLWGVRLASDAVTNEIRDGTWDSQRMSSIGAWSMGWGKLFGSTVYPWYGGLMCIAVYLISSIYEEALNPFEVTSVILVAGVFAQAMALSSSLMQARRKQVRGRTSSIVFLVVGVFIVLPIIQLALNNNESVIWYGQQYDHYYFSITSLILITAWLIVAIYRQMRIELQMQCTPLVWMAFITSIALYLAGFVELNGQEAITFNVRTFIVYGVFITAAYLTIFFEPKNPVTFRRLFYQLEHAGYRKAFYHVPIWVATLFLVIVSVVVILLNNSSTIQAFNMEKVINLKIFVVASVFFLMRDMLLILYLNFGDKVKRADSAAMVYLFVLYFIIPGIFSVANLPIMKAMFIPFSADYISNDNYFVYSMWSALFQMVFMFWLLIKRWTVLNQKTDVI